jgi:aerobic-type carbon monoxide dehydrogenase small subunit (CoxS/CutS family)
MFRLIKLSINGRPWWVEIKSETEHLSGLLRLLGVVGPSADCNTGQCAACTVLLEDSPVRSCNVKSERCAGKDITTAESLVSGPSVHPMLASFRNNGIAACPTCMPGMVLAAIAYAARDRNLTEHEVGRDLVASGCRCESAGNMIVAVIAGARAMHSGAI